MSISAIKKHLVSDEEIQLSTYKKLPPIQTPQKMSGRQVVSPSSVSVEFNPADTFPSKQLSRGNVPVRKRLADLTKSDTGISFSQTAGNKKTNPLRAGSKSAYRSNGDVTLGQMTNGIELIGYKMTESQSATTSEKIAVSQQASDWTPLSSELPPCRVCGEKASGLHYGVNTCEACKAFFRRTLKKSTVDFQCTCTAEEKMLGTDQPRKTTCPKCRYERCIKTGMSKDAIKIGRYTISRKRQNNHEVKTLKQGETTLGVRRVSESSKSTSSSSPYSTNQGVSSPEELSSDITSLSLQEKEVTQEAKKRRHDDEDGLLYQSLTNSIFMSLLDPKQEALHQASQNSLPVEEVATSNTQVVSDATAMEQLLISNHQDNTEQFKTHSVTDVSAVDPLMTSYEDKFEDFSPMENILSTYGQEVNETSPIEHLLMEPTVATTDTSLSDTYTTQVERMADYSANVAGLSPSLYGINDGRKIYSKMKGTDQLVRSEISEESPIENLLTTHSQRKPYSTILTVTYNNMLSNLKGHANITQNNETLQKGQNVDGMQNELSDQENSLRVVHSNMQREEMSQKNLVEDLGGNALIASKLNEKVQKKNDESECCNEDFETSGFDEADFIEDLEDIEIQALQLYRFENPVIQVGQGITVEEATNMILTLGQAASVLFDNTKKLTCEEIKKRHSEYLEQYMLKMQLFGDMSNISKEEYLEFYNQTGIDIDDRQQILIEALKYMEESIAKLVKFAKAIPGFSDLDIDDQVNLVKASLIEYGLIKPYDTQVCKVSDSHVATMPWDRDYHVNELLTFFPAELLELKKVINNEIDEICLSEEEAVVLRAVVVTALASRFEHDMIQFGKIGKCVKSSLKVATTPWNKEYHFDEISKIFPKKFCTVKIENLQRIIQLGLSFEETVILKALIITFPDRCGLKERQKVEYLHNQLIACFLFMLGNRPPEKLVTVQAVLGTLFKIRQLAVWDTQIIQEMFEVWPVTSNHQLVKEFVS